MSVRRALAVLLLAVAALLLGGARAGAQTTTTTAPADAAGPADEVQAIFAGPQFGDFPDNHYRYYTGDGSTKVDVPGLPDLPGVPVGTLEDIAKGIGAVPKQVDTGIPSDRTASGWFADLGWSIGQQCASIIRALVHWLYTFGFVRVLSPIVEYLAGILNGIALGPLSLARALWLFTGAALAWRLIAHRRFASFFADLAIAVVLFIAAGALIAKPAAIFDGVANLAGDIAQLPLAVIGGTPDNADPAKGLTEAEVALKEVWTVAPWEVTNFGHTLSGACKDAGQAIARNGPYPKTDDRPRKVMAAAGCKAEADYNAESTPSRTAIIFLLGAAGAAAAAFILAMAWGFARAIVRFGRLIVVGGYAFFFAMTPYSHDVAWSWLRDLLNSFIAIIVPSWVLASMLVADVLVLRLPAIPLGVQAFLVLVINVGVFHHRRTLVTKVAARLSGGVNRVHARVANVDAASLDAKRRSMEQARGVHDLMPGSKLVTVPLVAGAVGFGRNVAAKTEKARKVGGTVATVAATATGAGGAAVTATKVATFVGAKDAAGGVADTARSASKAAAGVAGVAQQVSVKGATRAAEYRAKRDARRGVGHAAPGAPQNRPSLDDLGPVHGPSLDDVDTLAPGYGGGPSLAELIAAEKASSAGGGAAKVA